jgi:UDP-glucuronate 4-epimerase
VAKRLQSPSYLKTNYKIIITGATGFIGKQVLKLLPKYYDKKDVLCLVWDTDSKHEVEGRNDIEKLGYKIHKVDLLKKNTLKYIPKDPHLIIHLAANTNTSLANHEVNNIGTKNLYDSIEKISKKRHIVYASTIALVAGRTDSFKPIINTKDFAITNEYGRTKAEAEKFLRKKAVNDGFKLTCVRIATVYGPKARQDSMFPMLINRVCNDSITTKINWPGIASFIHVDDCARAILELSTQRIKSINKNRIFYLANESYSIDEVTNMIYKKINKCTSRIVIPKFLWSLIKKLHKTTPKLEKFLSSSIYNWIWRFGLLVDNATWCDTSSIWKNIPKWKHKNLDDSLTNLISSVKSH